MNQEDIFRMVREAGGELAELELMHAIVFSADDRQWNSQELERFVELVARHERERIIALNAPVIDRVNTHIKELEAAVAAEREACAKLADEQLMNTSALMSMPAKSSAAWNIAAAIRARGTE